MASQNYNFQFTTFEKLSHLDNLDLSNIEEVSALYFVGYIDTGDQTITNNDGTSGTVRTLTECRFTVKSMAEILDKVEVATTDLKDVTTTFKTWVNSTSAAFTAYVNNASSTWNAYVTGASSEWNKWSEQTIEDWNEECKKAKTTLSDTIVSLSSQYDMSLNTYIATISSIWETWNSDTQGDWNKFYTTASTDWNNIITAWTTLSGDYKGVIDGYVEDEVKTQVSNEVKTIIENLTGSGQLSLISKLPIKDSNGEENIITEDDDFINFAKPISTKEAIITSITTDYITIPIFTENGTKTDSYCNIQAVSTDNGIITLRIV